MLSGDPLVGAALRSLVKSARTRKKASGLSFLKKAGRTRHSKTSRRVNPPGCDFASRGLTCPRSLLVSRILTKLSIDKVPGDLSFLDDQTAPKSYCLKMTEARSQNGYHRDASSNNPQSKEGDRRGDEAETQHPIGSRES